ncbi:MAG TPA: hypothetical protein VLA62_01185, partial [Solirubrobacterales bacterium]|nr:hypothetical protein [Solirubrobacterales bacterium]
PLLPPDESRDGVNLMAGFAHYFRFEGDRHYLKVGYQFDVDDTDGRNYRYNGHRLLAGGQYTLPWRGIALRYDYDAHFRSYRYVNSIFPITAPDTVKRSDTEQNHRVGIVVPLPYNLTALAEFQGTVARSNLDVFTFNRNVFSFSLIWAY